MVALLIPNVLLRNLLGDSTLWFLMNTNENQNTWDWEKAVFIQFFFNAL